MAGEGDDEGGRERAAVVTDGRLCSPSFERNAEPIADVLERILSGRSGTVLEVASGPGQHAAHFARRLAPRAWLPSDPLPEHLTSIAAWRAHAGVAGLLAPIRLDATEHWATAAALTAHEPFAAVYAQNLCHIAPWRVTLGLIAGAAQLLKRGGLLLIYGPFSDGGAHVSESNARFDASLRLRDPTWGVRDIDAVGAAARQAGFGPPEAIAMPANNRLLRLERA